MNLRDNIKTKIKSIIGKETLEFVNHAKNYMTADFIGKGIGFLTIPIFTRLLTPDEYGYLSIFSSIVSIFAILLILNLSGPISRYYYERKEDYDSFVGSILNFVILFNLIIVPLLLYFRKYFSQFFSVPNIIFVLAILTSIFVLPIKLLMNYFQASKQSKKYSIISVLKQVIILPIAIVWTILLVNNRYLGKISANVLVTGGFAIYGVYKLLDISNFKLNIKKNHLFYALAYGVPLIPHSLSNFILNRFDQIIINQLTGSYNTGLYAFAYKIGMIITIISGAMNKSYVPIFFDNYEKENYKKINTIALNYSNYMFFLALGLILFSQEAVYIMADSSYHVALPLIPVIVIGGIFQYFYLLYGNYAFYKKKTGIISILTLAAGFFNIFLNYLLIPRFGYSVAAFTTLISYFSLFIFHFMNVKFILKLKGLIYFIPIFKNFIILIVLTSSYILLMNKMSYIYLLVIKMFFIIFALYYYILKD